jgi:predicted nuclease of predicted toxin-antitoxin system
MRFLADESCDFAVVRALRAAGHDVVAVGELSPRAEDETVVHLAVKEKRVVLTEDKDFGQLVYADRRASGGILLLRFPATARSRLAKAVLELVNRRGEQIIGRFIVIQPGRIRIGGTPGG